MSGHCHDEHSHSHSHSHDGGHDHSDDLTPALQNHIYQQIEFDSIMTLNETVPNSGALIVKKPWSDRLNPDPELVSDTDAELLMYIPFTGQIKLHSLLLRSSDHPSAPSTVHLFLNRDDLDFNAVRDVAPTQTLQLSRTNETQDVPLKRALWNTTRSLTLFFEGNFAASQQDQDGDGDGDGEEGEDDGEKTRLSYLGFKGEFMPLNREPVNVLYEAAPNPADHKIRGTGIGRGVGSGVGGGGAGGANAEGM
ncbi:MAG: hypothetical protein M1816_002952 [Peltula sp. TS41687]|nr:MAG: hypothetical protein M1816_002952 [Peltula sp. TS41687]